jgi:hypothetical protein
VKELWEHWLFRCERESTRHIVQFSRKSSVELCATGTAEGGCPYIMNLASSKGWRYMIRKE